MYIYVPGRYLVQKSALMYFGREKGYWIDSLSISVIVQIKRRRRRKKQDG